MVYTLEELRDIVAPIAAHYRLKAVYVFGSYARGEAREDSDVDLLVDISGAEIKTLLQLSAVYCDLEDALGKQVDLVTAEALERDTQAQSKDDFQHRVWNERVRLYAAA